ncbi:unnamed protein product [Closterium sp. NIES-53]
MAGLPSTHFLFRRQPAARENTRRDTRDYSQWQTRPAPVPPPQPVVPPVPPTPPTLLPLPLPRHLLFLQFLRPLLTRLLLVFRDRGFCSFSSPLATRRSTPSCPSLNAAAAKDLPPHRSHDGERRLIACWTNPLLVRTTTWSSGLLTVSPSTFQFPPFPLRIKKGPTHLANRKNCLAVSIARLQKWSHEVKGKSLGHLTPEVKKKFGELNLVPAVIPAGCTSEIQPLDVAVNRSFKAAVRQLYQEWFEREGVDTLTKKGNIKKPPVELTLKWISAAWKSVPKELIQRAFLTCGISNALDGSQDKLCLQHRREKLEGEEVNMDDEIAAHSFFCNNVEEPESDSEADPDDPTAADD